MTEVTLGSYTLGLAGLALIRRWYEDDGAQRRAQLLAMAADYQVNELLQFALQTDEQTALDGYTLWAETYDGVNPMIEAEEHTMLPMLQALAGPNLKALDAGCGTGRHSLALANLGFDVVGVDLTPAMLDVARAKVPQAEFLEGTFEQLPVDDNSVDLVTSALAVCHATDLGPVFSEFARVLKPGGRVVLSDPHPVGGQLGGQAFFPLDGAMPYVRNHTHPLASYVQAMSSNGFMVEDLRELPYTTEVLAQNPASAFYPEITQQALEGLPFVVVWQAKLVP